MQASNEHTGDVFSMTATSAALLKTKQDMVPYAVDNGIVNKTYFELHPYLSNGTECDGVQAIPHTVVELFT